MNAKDILMNEKNALLEGVKTQAGKDLILEFYEDGSGYSVRYEFIAKMVKLIEQEIGTISNE